jgi:cytochrome P450 RapN
VTVIEQTELPTYPFVVHDDLTIDPAYRELQQRGPFKAQLPFGEPIWIATRYEDVRKAYGDRRMGKAVGYDRDTPRLHEMVHGSDPTRLDNMDPPNHTRIRRLASQAFTPPQIKIMTVWIDHMVTTLFDDLESEGKGADFMELYAWKLPLQVISAIIGGPVEMIPTLRGWVDELTGQTSSLEQRYEAYLSIQGFVRGLITERRENVTDDLLYLLVQARDDDDRLNEDELVSLTTTLFLGGFETTAAQLGSMVWTLMAYPHLWRELVDDRDLVPNAMEELWRFIPSFRHGRPMIRWASEDVEMSDGVMISAGDPVLPEHQVANRDETVFENGWEPSFHRTDPAPHLSLSWGPHRCLGARLAHLELEITLRELLKRFPGLELTVDPEDVQWSPVTFLRSALTIPITW